MKKIELIPNCSELTCRIDPSDIKNLEKAGLRIEGKVKGNPGDDDYEDDRSIIDDEYGVSLGLSNHDGDGDTVMVGDYDTDEFPTLQKISDITGNEVHTYDGGHISTYEAFLNNRITRIKLSKKQHEDLKILLTTEVILDKDLIGKRFGRYLKLKNDEQMYLPEGEVKILEKFLKKLFPGKTQKELLGEDYDPNAED